MAFRRLGTVRIMHPGCSRLILALPAHPHPPAAGGTIPPPAPGVDHRLVLDACHVVTNDASEEPAGYLSEDREGHYRVPAPSDEPQLVAGEYFYHPVPPSTTTIPNYPIVTDFAAWKFPHMLPDHWIRPEPSLEEIADLRRLYGGCSPRDMRPAVRFRDNACLATGERYFCLTQVAHLVPPAHQDWFHRNDMARYNWGWARNGVHDPANGLTLRVKWIKMLGLNLIVFFPAGEGKFMTYVCYPSLGDCPDVHRTLVTIPRRVPEAFLYARFAYTMITLVARNSKLDAFPLPEGVKPSRKGG
ncbi:hypothetical protein LXA43DRAFT_711826 [Ganoderma leucocontextum]|nr:hypothetical protein LXA43DRAFT_711826 [Ganoderma leucocontextum]